MSKEGVISGILTAFFFDPIVLLALVIAGFVILAIFIGALALSGWMTGVVLFLVVGSALAVLHYIKAVDLKQQPLLFTFPVIMLFAGYGFEQLGILSIQPIAVVYSSAARATFIAQIIFIAIIISLAAAVILKSKRR